MVTFLTYYVKPPPEELEKIKASYKLLHRKSYAVKEDPDEIISIMFASAKKYHPDARCCLITDKTSQFNLDPSIEIIRYPRKTYKLDLEILRALIFYLKTAKEEVNTIFLEWDQVVQSNISHMFTVKYDLYLPFRRIPPTPFDDSIIGISSGDYAGVIDFFMHVLKEYKMLKSQYFRYWLGKSMIFSIMLFNPMIKSSRRYKRVIAFRFKNIMIAVLNAKKYSRKLLVEETKQYQEDSHVVHFSNKKCRYMKEYWEKFVKDR